MNTAEFMARRFHEAYERTPMDDRPPLFDIGRIDKAIKGPFVTVPDDLTTPAEIRAFMLGAAAAFEALPRHTRADAFSPIHRRMCMSPEPCSECDRIAALQTEGER